MDRNIISEKLTNLYESEKCKKGYHYCPIAKACVKTDKKKQGKGLQHGQGEGPIGEPKKGN